MSQSKRLKLIDPSAAGSSRSTSGKGSSSYPPNIRDGVITHVKLKNFMNHESLDIEFHHRVNVLCGSNGAGKSSVLQAIVLGLGGNAQDTKRSRAVKNFVRYNCTRAEIEVTLFNGSEESFRPNVYGKTITFRRIIQSTGTSSYFISGEENKTIYEGSAAREERSKILSHFLIELDNPTSILQQEEAKKFFEGKSDSELYDFFLRATGIKSTRLSYDKASLDLNLGKNYVEKIRRDLEDENTELRELEEKLRKSQIVNDKKQDAGIKAELKWNMADSKKSDLDKATQERDKIMATVKILESDIEKEKNARKELQSARDKVDADLHINRESLEVCETQREKLDRQSKGADEEWQSYLNEIDQKQTSVASMRREIRELGNEILKHKKRKEVDERKASAEREQCKKDLASLEKQKEANSKKIQDWGKVREDGQEQLDKIKEEERSKKKELHRLGKELERAEEDLVRSRSASSSANLARFGPKIEAMVQEINSGRVSFRKKPIGPIGMHMKLTELASGQPEIPSLLESFLGYERFRGFLVDNNDDWKKLNEIMKRHFYGQKPPNIYTVQFKSRRDDISRGMVRSTSEIKTILDYLIVDDDNVFMHLVEWARIESTLVVTDAQAQRLFGRQENVPPNALKAITPTFYSYEPASKRSNYASYHINRRSPSILVQDKQSNVRQLEIKRNELKCKINEADCSFKDFERRTTDANKDISRAKKEISQLQLNIKDCLSKTQERMNRLHELNQDQNVENLQARKAGKEAEIKAIEKELEGSKARKAKLKEEQDILKKKLNDIEDQIKNLRKDSELIRNHDAFQKIAGIDQKILCFEKELTKKRRDLREKETAFSSKQREYDAALKEARKLNASMEHGERRPLPEVIALLNELERARDEHGRKDDRAKLTRLLQEKQAKISELERKIRTALDFSEEAYDEGERRKICLDIFRESISRNMVKIFNAEIFKQDMAGNLIFNSGKEALKIRIGNNGGDVKELHQLSGGERSKTLVSLIISFWVHMSPPFRCLDEWDVFLDEKSRSATEKVLVQHALSSPYQFIFISPQTSNVEGVHKIRIGE